MSRQPAGHHYKTGYDETGHGYAFCDMCSLKQPELITFGHTLYSKHLYLCVLYIFSYNFTPHVMTQINDCELLAKSCAKALTR